jgi:hypothetical protein
MTSRGVREPPRQQPERTKGGKSGGNQARTGNTGSGRAVYSLLIRAANHAKPANQPHRPGNRSPERMGRGELYEYYKRIGMLEVYFALFPRG